MLRTAIGTCSVLFLGLVLFAVLVMPAHGHPQREREIEPPDESAYGTRFFDQLRSVFGRFRDADLQRAFQLAEPIQCPELVTDKGEWQPVAFFNENRKLGEWYRSSLDEVKSALEVYIFRGTCAGPRGTVRLTTKFPVIESLQAYNDGKISAEEIDVNVNAPVNAAFDSRTQAYTFDLPYLFLVRRQPNDTVYSLMPQHIADRDRYALDVTSHWDCKSVIANDVTYRFLICRTTTLPRDIALRNQARTNPFGASAYFILSDGREASSSVKLSFGDPGETQPPPATPTGGRSVDSNTPAKPAPLLRGWQPPDSASRIVDAGGREFRIRFNAQTWKGELDSPQILSDQKMSSQTSIQPQAGRLQVGGDYCNWLPGASGLLDQLLASEPDENVSYTVKALEKDGQSPSTIVFDMKTHTGAHLGALLCFFPRAESAASVIVSRWQSIAGGHLTIEIKP